MVGMRGRRSPLHPVHPADGGQVESPQGSRGRRRARARGTARAVGARPGIALLPYLTWGLPRRSGRGRPPALPLGVTIVPGPSQGRSIAIYDGTVGYIRLSTAG